MPFVFSNSSINPRLYLDAIEQVEYGLILRRRGKFQGFTVFGVAEAQLIRVQGDALRLYSTSVLTVSRYGAASGGELYPYLMGSACVEAYFYKGDFTVFSVIYRVETSVFQLRVLRSLARSIDGEGLTAEAVTEQIVSENSIILLRSASDAGQVFLYESGMVCHLCRQLSG